MVDWDSYFEQNNLIKPVKQLLMLNKYHLSTVNTNSTDNK